ADARVELLAGRLTLHRLAHLVDVDRVRTDRGETDATILDHAVADGHGRTGRHDRPVARSALDLVVGAAAVGLDGDAHLGEHLAVTHRRLVRPAVEVRH